MKKLDSREDYIQKLTVDLRSPRPQGENPEANDGDDNDVNAADVGNNDDDQLSQLSHNSARSYFYTPSNAEIISEQKEILARRQEAVDEAEELLIALRVSVTKLGTQATLAKGRHDQAQTAMNRRLQAFIVTIKEAMRVLLDGTQFLPYEKISELNSNLKMKLLSPVPGISMI